MFSKVKIETPKDKRMAVIGIICIVYILNPTFGIFELIPDNLPLIGNLDEAAAVASLLNVAKYFGYDFTSWFSTKR